MAQVYRAPGVYVEEVPSALQPIAGVGTNTAGFIGIIPEDDIEYPVPNELYDPVLAQDMRKASIESKSGELTEKTKEILTAQASQLSAEIKIIDQTIADFDDALTKIKGFEEQIAPLELIAEADRSDAQKQDLAAKKQERQNLIRSQGSLNKIEVKKSEAEDARMQKQNTLDAFNTQLNPPAAAKDGAVKNEVDSGPSELRPYRFEKFHIKPASRDTKFCTNFSEYVALFGGFSADDPAPIVDPNDPENPSKWHFKAKYPGHRALTHAVYGFFQNGGTRCYVARIKDESELGKALEAFESIDEVALIAAPGLDASKTTWELLETHAENNQNVFALLDCPENVEDKDTADVDVRRLDYSNLDNVLPRRCKNAAFYFPYIEVVDPAKQLQDDDPAREVATKYRGRVYVAPSGHMAGIYARTDEERGVYKAPANCTVRGAIDVKYYISKPKQEVLNPQGVNCIRNLNGDIIIWGARTVGGDRNGEWKYIGVRRLFLFLQESIDEGTQWAVFEPNDQALWGKIRLNVSAFLTNVWRSGALFGRTPEEAFYVKCDAETNPSEVRDLGQVITEIGVAIVRPAEFVIFRISQSTNAKS